MCSERVRHRLWNQATARNGRGSVVDSPGAREEPLRGSAPVSCHAPAPACELAPVWRSPDKICADALSRRHASEAWWHHLHSVHCVHNARFGLGSRCTNGAGNLGNILLCETPAETRAALHPARKLAHCLLAQGARRLHSNQAAKCELKRLQRRRAREAR